VTVASDPPGCNTDPNFNKAPDGHQMLSMYRRPRVSAGMNYVTTTQADLALPPATDPITQEPIPNDPTTNKPESGNVMWDGWEPTLEHQAIDATLGHAQATTAPSLAEVMQIVAFEKGIFSAQAWDARARRLTTDGARGGPVELSAGTRSAAADRTRHLRALRRLAESTAGHRPRRRTRVGVAWRGDLQYAEIHHHRRRGHQQQPGASQSACQRHMRGLP
jgi:hypothetical protein